MLALLAALGLNSSTSRYGISSSIVSSFILSLCSDPNSISRARKPVSVNRYFCVHVNDGLKNGMPSVLPMLIVLCSTRSSGSMNSTRQPSNVILMMSFGLPSFLISLMSAALMLRIALSALCTNGIALSRSSWHCRFCSAMSAASRSQSLLITATRSLSCCAAVCSTCRFASIAFVSSVALASSTCFCASTTLSASTSSAPLISLRRPKFTRAAFSSTSASLRLYMSWKLRMNDKYDLGVWYTCRRIFTKYSSHTSTTSRCTMPMCRISSPRTSSSHSSSMSPMSPSATLTSAASGQGRNQSMVQQEKRPGNLRARSAKRALMGEKHSTMCRLSRTRSVKNCFMLSGVSSTPGRILVNSGRISAHMPIISSLVNRPATSPVSRMLLTNSRKFSSFTSASVMRKVTGCASRPAFSYSARRSSMSAFTP